MKNNKYYVAALCGAVAIAGVVSIARAKSNPTPEVTSNNLETTISTNENGLVTKTWTEFSATTNGNMISESRRQTTTTTDSKGNILSTATSEMSQSYSREGNVASFTSPDESRQAADSGEEKNVNKAISFMGLELGKEYKADKFEQDAENAPLLRAEFKPAKPLDGFDDYYVYVTPKSRKIAKIYACAKNEIDPGSNWRGNYLMRALEKRYGAVGRLCSLWKPCFIFDVGGDSHVTACLACASIDYGTVIVAWDGDMVRFSEREYRELRIEERKKAEKERTDKLNKAVDAF